MVGMGFSIDTAIKRIRQFRKEQGITKYRLACMAGVPENSVRKLDSVEWNPTLETLRSLDSVIPKDFSPRIKSQKISPDNSVCS